MNAVTEISLDALHQAIIDAVAGQFPDLATVEDYREDRKSLPLPAVLIELVDLEAAPDEDPGTGQLAMTARFEARVIIGFRTASAEREIRKLAAALGAFARLNRWGMPVGPAEVLTIGPDDFSPELDQYVVWRVDWAQVVHLGASVWVNDGTIPNDVLYSVVPEIGPGNEDAYRNVLEPE
jgi:hypothetical protein